MGSSSSKPEPLRSQDPTQQRSPSSNETSLINMHTILPDPDDKNRPSDTPRTCWAHSNAKSAYDRDLPPCKSLSQLEILRLIGRGSFGKVCLVKRCGGEGVYALKSLKKEHLIRHSEVEHTLAERLILARIRHPFIVRLESAFQDSTRLFLLLEFVNGGELFTHLRNSGHFSPTRVRLYAAEIACALSYLHQHNIIYRDLKLENILLDQEGHIVLTDFGLSKIGKDGKTFCGTPEYLAPEVISDGKHSKAVDWWAFGCIIYELLTGLPPFYSENINEMYNKTLTQPLYLPPYMNEDTKDFLRKILRKDPIERLGSKGFSEIKSHNFFKNMNFDDVFNRRLIPEYIPPTNSPSDVQHIDQDFLSQAPESFNPLNGIVVPENNPFKGFTYVAGFADKGPRMSALSSRLGDDGALI